MRKQVFCLYGGLIVLSLSVACTKTNSVKASEPPAAGGKTSSKIVLTAAPGGYTLAYEENFNNNSLNTSAWYYRESDKKYTGGGFNRRENVSVVTNGGIGYLNISYNKDTDWDNDGTKDLSAGGIITNKTFGYGYYEARIKFYHASGGIHQSFWTHGLGINTTETSGKEYNDAAKRDLVPTDNRMVEIDGIELDSYNNTGKTNFWFNARACDCPKESNAAAFSRYDASYMDLDTWITVGFEWVPGTVNYYINGVMRHSYSYQTPGFAPMEVWLSALANNSYWYPGTPSNPLPGASMMVDYFRYYNKPIPANLIGNNSFEFGGKASEQVTSWVVYDGIDDNNTTDGVSVVYDSTAYEGKAYLKQEGKTGVPVITTKHLLNYIPNGNYRLTAWVKRSGGMTSARMRALNIGSGDRYVDIPVSTQWTKMTLDNINVTSNKAVIGFSTTGPNGEFLKVDKVELFDKQFD